MRQLSHLIGEPLQEAIDEIEAFAIANHCWLKFVEGDGCLDRKKLNVCVKDGTIREFIITE
ncbi:MAG TPA: hypothetical protein VGH47_13750 [Xanthobacteraceae bacterium]|jgi:hypothetical protein